MTKRVPVHLCRQVAAYGIRPLRALPHPSPHRCCFSSVTTAFDHQLKRLQRDGASRAIQKWRRQQEAVNDPGSSVIDYDYLRREIAARLVDRLDDIKKEGGFPLALDLGSSAGYLHRAICADDAIGEGQTGGIGGINRLVQLDSSELSLHRDDDFPVDGEERCKTFKIVSEEEGKLGFPDGTFDLVLSCDSLHYVNDLPKLLLEVRRILKPDGCFMFALVGGSTLSELRSSMVLAEMERDGGVSPHVGPFVDFADVGSLLTAAGFTLPTVDIDTIHFGYPDAAVLMEHLQRMGENNASMDKRDRVGLDTFLASAALYQQQYKIEVDPEDEDSVNATVQVIYGIGWTPHESQPKPLARGSATHKIGEL